nr:class 1 isoprenoid biosynthesis enzyme [Paenibacillus bouchesdurhonensis]
MLWLSNYEEDLQQAFAVADKLLSAFPTSFSQPARDFLDKFHVMKEHRSKNYICYLLPFWLQEKSEVSSADCRKIAIANIFGMLYYHLIDDLMDNPDARFKHQLPLADLIHFEFMSIYREYFPTGSPFWSYFRKYVSEWADAVTHENSNNFFLEHPVRVAHKAAPVKLSVAAICLLSGQEQMIPLLEDNVDTVLITLQMLDDWMDWEKDLKEGSYNCLIALIQTKKQLPENQRPTPEEIRHAIYTEDILLEYALQVEAHHRSLETVRPNARHLYDFHEFLYQNVQQGANQIETDRKLLEKGGLEYWLSKKIINS